MKKKALEIFQLLACFIWQPTFLYRHYEDLILSTSQAANYNEAAMFCMQYFKSDIATINTTQQLTKVKINILQRFVSKYAPLL